MDGDRIFDELDRLQRGSRAMTRPTASVYNDSRMEYSAYDEPTTRYGEAQRYDRSWPPEELEFEERPLTLDSFDERLLRQADLTGRQSEATLGRGRLSLPPAAALPRQAQCHGERMPMQYTEPHSRRFDLSQYAYDQAQHGPSTSSPFQQQLLPSSPSFNASQRRLAAPEDEYEPTPVLSRSRPQQQSTQPSHYRAAQHENQEVARRVLTPLTQQRFTHDFQPSWTEPQQNLSTNIGTKRAPVVQGIELVPTHWLPDRLRSIFPYPLFNAVQSKSFNTVYQTNDNFVLAAPTGSGKTAILELAVCRLIHTFQSDTYKIVYQAPTKSLCAERQRDWQAKFGPLGLQCAELTGDTDNAHLRHVQQASIIIATPEKWDSITRKWKDHQRLMQMVKLLLIDEVHILKEDRGATLEAVVSRMKSVGSDVRFVALSATVPNLEDIAAWLGRDSMNPQTPAARERFGEEFRPVRLKKHVIGYQNNSNDFAFDKTLTQKLPEVITKWSQRKPIMVFCFVRSSCVETAKLLATWWSTKGQSERYWSAPRKGLVVDDNNLREVILSGVAFHHAGLSIQDRNVVEKAYLEGDINVICCTSTLAVGVNLPCHMVIIKNTVTYTQLGGTKEYSDLEIMQMLGRAGRPQFDDSAVAVIMTRSQRVPYYEMMISGQEVLESCLHRNLIDHLNAEIGLGTISSASSAKKWLSGTFLYVRLKNNPEHYKIDDGTSARNLDERLEQICSNGIAELEAHDLVTATPRLRCTEFGDAMARYYIQFATMKIIMTLPQHAKVSEILSAISRATEFKEIRFRAGEKPIYKDLNKNSSMKFPIPVNLDLPPHKVSLIIQSVLGAIDLPTEEQKHRAEYNTNRSTIFQHVNRLIRCIIDCQLFLEDAVTTRNALMLARSFGAQVWDDSPLHIKQLENIGVAYVRRLVAAGINSIEELETVEAHRIEQIISRNPPLGSKIHDAATAFPKLRISLKTVGEPLVKKGVCVTVKFNAEIGFLNKTVPEVFQRRTVNVICLAETSDGHKLHFARISARKLGKGQDVLFEAKLTDASQSVRAYVMCDEIAGTMRHAMLKPPIPASAFASIKADANATAQQPALAAAVNAKRQAATSTKKRAREDDDTDEFGDPDLDDADFMAVENGGFVDIDTIVGDKDSEPMTKRRKTNEPAATGEENWAPRQLPNGKWACNHKCTDKAACKHLCCREGLDKKPKPPKAKHGKKDAAESVNEPKQTQLNISATKKTSTQALPSAQRKTSTATAFESIPKKTSESKEARDLDRLHNSVVKSNTPKVPTLGPGRVASEASRSKNNISFSGISSLRSVPSKETAATSDYGLDDDFDTDDLPEPSAFVGTQAPPRSSPVKQRKKERKDNTDDEINFDSMDDHAFEAAMRDNHDDHRITADDVTVDEDLWNFDDGADNSFEDYAAGFVADTSPTTARKKDNVSLGWTHRDSDPSGGHALVQQHTAAHGQPSAAAARRVTHSENDRSRAAVKEQNAGVAESIEQPHAQEEEDEAVKWFKETFPMDMFNIVD